MKSLVFGAFGIVVMTSGCLSFAVAGNGPLKDDGSKDAAVKAELKRFEGTWKFVSMEINGKAVPGASLKDSSLTFDGSRFLSKSDEQNNGTFAVDPTVTPKTIDIAVGDEGKIKILGIYELEGDTYKICSAPPGKPRPTEFSTRAGSGRGLTVMRREKP